MLNNKQEFTFEYAGESITLETGRLAKQADGAVLVSSKGTQVLVTAVSAKEAAEGQDFFPLLVDYKEKFYSAGKFLGGFNKREGRPSNAEILLMRMVDRPLRPLFPEGYLCETIIMAQVLSYNPAMDPEVLAGLGASAALTISDIPFNGPMGFCKVGRVEGKLVLNPVKEELEKSDLELVVAGSREALLMVEGEANEVPEAEVLEAIFFGHDFVIKYCEFLQDVQSKVGKAKREFVKEVADNKAVSVVETEYAQDVRNVLDVTVKLERQDATRDLIKKVAADMEESREKYNLAEDSSASKEAATVVDEVLYKVMRNDILKNHQRIGGRKLDEVRPIEVEVDLLHSVHGSSLFTRGETQVMAVVTVGSKEGEQLIDNLDGVRYENFYLHYTFPPFSVGEARGYRGVGRREIGHGNLAERSLRKVLPKNDFPYTIRVACEVLESNGSSSMGSVCSGSMALMDAGVPLKSPVAGVAMGLIKEDADYAILTDILGDEDHLGDMDFKVAGTTDGVTAIQMDIKIEGINREIFEKALAQAKVGRLHILGEMSKAISVNRKEFKDGVPVIESMKIDPDKIGALIGPGGKNIKALQEDYSVNISVEDDGTVGISGKDKVKLKDVASLITLQITGPKLNQDYLGTVVSVKEYGAFVDLAPNVSGLLHVSEIASERVRDVNEYVKVGDKVKVRVTEVDRFGKIKLSAKVIEDLKKVYA